MNKINIKRILSVFVLLGILLFSSFVFAEKDYDIINLDASNYNYDPAPVEQGNNFELWIQLTNNSNNAAENIDYLLDLEYPFSLADYKDLTGTISYIAPYQTKILKYTLKTDFAANAGTYVLKFKYKRDGVNVYNVQEYNIDVSNQKAIVDIISSDIEKVSIGDESIINLNLKNLSLRDAKDIFVTLGNSEDSKVKVLNLSTKYIEKLNSNQELNLEFSILVDKSADSKSYNLPIVIVYSDNSNEYTITRNIGVETIDNPNMLLNILEIGTNYTIKSNSADETIELEVYNVGNVDAESVYVEVKSSELIEGTTKYFIGTIEKNNYDNLDLKLNIKDVAAGTYNLEIISYYKDSNLKIQSISEIVEVEVVKNSTSGNLVTLIFSVISRFFGLIVGLALLIVIFKWLYKILIRPAFSSLFKNCKLRNRKK